MHSTREDVEALLGPPPPSENAHYTRNKRLAVYLVDDLQVFIYYTDEDSLAQSRCESVAAGIVWLIRVSPKTDMFLSGLLLDETSFKKYEASGNGDHVGFMDKKEGLAINAFQGKVHELIYFASASDGQRCPLLYGNPEDLLEVKRIGIACALKFDVYGNLLFSDEKARLDNFAIQLLNEERAVGYIIAYAGRKAVVAEAQLRANRARDYLISVREINPERVKAIDGGHREELTVELHVRPPGAPPPTAEPTVDPKEVEIIYEKKRSRKK